MDCFVGNVRIGSDRGEDSYMQSFCRVGRFKTDNVSFNYDVAEVGHLNRCIQTNLVSQGMSRIRLAWSQHRLNNFSISNGGGIDRSESLREEIDILSNGAELEDQRIVLDLTWMGLGVIL